MNERIIAPEYAPEKNVQLKNGLLFNAFENNKTYLKKHFTLDDLRYPFRDRIGQDAPAADHWLFSGKRIWKDPMQDAF